MTGAAVATATTGGRSRSFTAIAVAGSGVAAAVVGLALQTGVLAVNGSSVVPWSLIQNGSFALGATVLGGILVRHAAARAVGVVLLVCGITGAASILLGGLGDLALLSRSPLGVPLQLAAEVLWPLFVIVPLTLLPMVFPSGLLPGWLWRGFAALTAVAIAGLVFATLTHHVIPIGQSTAELDNPLAQPELSRASVAIFQSLLLVCAAAGVSSLIVRFIGGSRLMRQQLVLVGIAVALMLALILLGPLMPDVVFQLTMTVAPLWILGSIAVAVLRYELYYLNVVVNRVALYSALTVSLTALFIVVYIAALALAAQLPFAPSPWAAGALGATVAVLCAEPVRRRLQALLERRFLGERGRPLVAMTRLRQSMLEHDDGTITDAIGMTIAEAVRSPRVVISLFGLKDLPPVEQGRQSDRNPFVVPLLYRQERIGEIRIDRRSPSEEYGSRDRELLRQLADQAATILYAVRRDEELATARRDAITIAAEERAQLGRDLHDGLGPLLAGAGLTTEALRRGLPPGSQDELDAARLAERLRIAAGEVRRFAHELQPAPLASGGLSTALSDYVQSLDSAAGLRIDLHVDAGGLPEAVEQTAYFFVLEAVGNVIRHAGASETEVAVKREGRALIIGVTDNGTGFGSAYVSGIGLTSMRQRVQALGGSFSISTRPSGGTALRARIPVET